MNSRIALVSGGTGLVGKALLPKLVELGYSPRILSRHLTPSTFPTIEWDPYRGVRRLEEIEGTDLVVHLAGANVGGKRWSEKYKKEIRESRVVGTRVLVEQLQSLTTPPKIFLSASAVGIYGDRGGRYPLGRKCHRFGISC